MELTSSNGFAPIIEAGNFGSSSVDGDSINTGLLHRLAIGLSFGTIVGNSALTMYAGATEGAKTTALAFKYRIGSADWNSTRADELGTATAVTAAGLTLTAATFDHRLVMIDIDPAELPINKPWLTISIDNVASTLYLAAWAVLEARYASAPTQTVL